MQLNPKAGTLLISYTPLFSASAQIPSQDIWQIGGPPKQNVMAYYSFTKTSGSILHDKVSSYPSAVLSDIGHTGEWLYSSGSGIELSDDLLITGSFTISFWIKPNQWNDGTYISILGGGEGYSINTAAGISFWQNSVDDRVFMELYSSTAKSTISCSVGDNIISTNQKYNVILCWDGTNNSDSAKYYINNELKAIGQGLPASIDWADYPYFRFGRGSHGYDYHGYYNDLIIYNKCHNEGYRGQIYAAGNKGNLDFDIAAWRLSYDTITNQFRWYMADGKTAAVSASSNTQNFNINENILIMLSWDGTSGSLYINGELQESIPQRGKSFLLGKQQLLASNGIINEFLITDHYVTGSIPNKIYDEWKKGKSFDKLGKSTTHT